MSHLLKTVNPAAAEAISAKKPGAPLPDVGATIVFNCPPRLTRMGRKRAAAIVLHRDEVERTVDVLVIFGNSDTVEEKRVPEWDGSASRGWSYPAGSITGLRMEIDALRQMLIGDMDPPDEPLAVVMDNLIETVNALIPETPATAPARSARKRSRK